MREFRDLKVWQKAYGLTLSIYKLTSTYPSEERYGVTSQLRRAAVSITNNIAEGSKRKSQVDFARFLNMAEGSAGEIDCLLMLSKDLGYVSADALGPLAQELGEIGKMLYTLRSKVESAT